MDGLHAGSRAQFIVDTVDNMGPHYPRTLREWARRFEGCFVEVIAPELRKQYPDVMGDEELEIFRRKWLCELLSRRIDVNSLSMCSDYL